jgi:hypothetical protein
VTRSELETVYLNTDYVVHEPAGRITIRIGEVAAVAAAHWAFITACNPRSQPLSAAENAARTEALVQCLRDAGYRFLPGEGIGRAGAWPPEPSVLILDITEAAAVALAARFEQAAIVIGALGQPAQLRWIDAGAQS